MKGRRTNIGIRFDREDVFDRDHAIDRVETARDALPRSDTRRPSFGVDPNEDSKPSLCDRSSRTHWARPSLCAVTADSPIRSPLEWVAEYEQGASPDHACDDRAICRMPTEDADHARGEHDASADETHPLRDRQAGVVRSRILCQVRDRRVAVLRRVVKGDRLPHRRRAPDVVVDAGQ
jgi:hypothetical protein